jgi:hypothetical protein
MGKGRGTNRDDDVRTIPYPYLLQFILESLHLEREMLGGPHKVLIRIDKYGRSQFGGTKRGAVVVWVHNSTS